MSKVTITTITCDCCGNCILENGNRFVMRHIEKECDDMDICVACRDEIANRRITSRPPPPKERPTPLHDPRSNAAGLSR